MTTAKIDPDLKQALQAQPGSAFSLLLQVDRVAGDRERALQARSILIRRRLTLTPTYAVTCSGAAGLSLLDLPWIRSIEEDRPVFAL